jgi:hypothetical protein
MADAGAGEKLKVFISYCRRDSAAFAEDLQQVLQDSRFAAFLDRAEMEAVGDWQELLNGIIARCDVVVFIVSPEAVKSERSRWEIERAIELSKHIVPVIFRPVLENDIPDKLKGLQFLRWNNDLGWSGFRPELVSALRVSGTAPGAKVFISYRREDSKWPARQMYEALLRYLPHGRVFIDIDSIPPGSDFVEILQRQVKECELVLALIGDEWIGNFDPKTGQRRLDNPNDFVRIEICAALSRGIPVVPVLLDGALMPDEDQLPADMRTLSRKQAEFVAYRTFDADVDRLIGRLGLAKM